MGYWAYITTQLTQGAKRLGSFSLSFYCCLR